MVTHPTHPAPSAIVDRWLNHSRSFLFASFARVIASMSLSNVPSSFSNSLCSGFLHDAAMSSSSRRSLNSCSTSPICHGMVPSRCEQLSIEIDMMGERTCSTTDALAKLLVSSTNGFSRASMICSSNATTLRGTSAGGAGAAAAPCGAGGGTGVGSVFAEAGEVTAGAAGTWADGGR